MQLSKKDLIKSSCCATMTKPPHTQKVIVFFRLPLNVTLVLVIILISLEGEKQFLSSKYVQL